MSKIVYVTLDGIRYKAKVARSNGTWHCIILGPGPLAGKTVQLDEKTLSQARPQDAGPAIIEGVYTLVAPITGRVMQINVEPGEAIEKGSCAMVIEAMKMENELNVEVSGTVLEVLAREGDMVETGQTLMRVSCQSAAPSSP